MKIGVFDSGVGGLSMARAIEREMPDLEIAVREDKAHLPYGDKSPEELLGFVVPIFQSMVNDGCEVIVVACNTVTTTIISELREQFTIPLVAVEPMVKPGAELTKSKVIAVCATPATLTSERYKWLKDTHAKGVRVLEPDCSDWAMMIENEAIEGQKIANRISEVLAEGADVIVLACTHYHWIEHEIKVLAQGRAKVIQPETAIVKRLKQVLQYEAI